MQGGSGPLELQEDYRDRGRNCLCLLYRMRKTMKMTPWTKLVQSIYKQNKSKKGFRLGNAMKLAKGQYKKMKKSMKMRGGKTCVNDETGEETVLDECPNGFSVKQEEENDTQKQQMQQMQPDEEQEKDKQTQLDEELEEESDVKPEEDGRSLTNTARGGKQQQQQQKKQGGKSRKPKPQRRRTSRRSH